MAASIRSIAFLALGLGMATVTNAAIGDSGTGKTTRYWDCCKGSCSWPDKAAVSSPVQICDKNDSPLSDANTDSACDGGTAYMCSDQSPWAVSDDLAYGFAAVSLPGGTESSWCCSCFELTFTSTSIAGKKMIVQTTNTGSDLAEGQFDLAIPGGGVGLFNACTDEWGAPDSGWGAQYGGISTDTCSKFPSALEPGCSFRFGSFFEGADNPEVEWKQVTCPKALTDKTGCVRDGETPTTGSGDEAGSGYGAGSSEPVASATKPASSTSEVAYSTVVQTSSTIEQAPSYAAAPPSSTADAVSSAAPPYVESEAPIEPTAVPQAPPSYGTSTVGGVAYTSSSPASPPYPISTGQPSGGDGQCVIEYVYVDGGSI